MEEDDRDHELIEKIEEREIGSGVEHSFVAGGCIFDQPPIPIP